MAVRGWGGPVATAIGVAAGAGAAQLGFGYGLGIVAWLPAAEDPSDVAWVAGLAWATWIAATATIAGAVVAQRTSAPGPFNSAVDTASADRTVPRLVLALASAVGGLVTVLLVAVPARAATRTDTFSPQTIAAGYAALGVLVGLLAAVWALSSRAAAANIVATVCWLWLIAVSAVVDGVLSGRGPGTAQLGVWQPTPDTDRFWIRDHIHWPGAALTLGSAVLIGALTARAPARHAHTRLGAAVSGVAGPLLVAIAYFLSAPPLVGIRPEQLSAYLTAPYAAVLGLAGSALVASYAQRSAGAHLRRAGAAGPGEPEPVAPVFPTDPDTAVDSGPDRPEPFVPAQRRTGRGSGRSRQGGSGVTADDRTADWISSSDPLAARPEPGPQPVTDHAPAAGPQSDAEPATDPQPAADLSSDLAGTTEPATGPTTRGRPRRSGQPPR
ncbi:MAG TPA: hypothetical protein VGD43_00520 [Micromonospora sp.]